MSYSISDVDENIVSLEYLHKLDKLDNDKILLYMLYFSDKLDVNNPDEFVDHINYLIINYQKDSDFLNCYIKIFSWSAYQQEENLKHRSFTFRHLNNFFYLAPSFDFDELVKELVISYPNDPNLVSYIITLMKIMDIEKLDETLVQDIQSLISPPEINYDKEKNEDDEDDEKIVQSGKGINLLKRYLESNLYFNYVVSDIPNDIKRLPDTIEQRKFMSNLPMVAYDLDINDQDINKVVSIIQQNIKENDIIILEENTNEQLNSDEKKSEFEKFLSSKILSLTRYEKDKITSGTILNLFKLYEIVLDRKLFLLYGPVNPYINQNWSTLIDEDGTLDINKIYGGPRMLLDRSTQPYDESNNDDWFKNICYFCKKIILKRSHARRIPEFYGGWTGCFCSWTCVRSQLNSIYENLNPNLNREELEYQMSLLKDYYGEQNIQQIEIQLLLVDSFEKIIEKIGILDLIEIEDNLTTSEWVLEPELELESDEYEEEKINVKKISYEDQLNINMSLDIADIEPKYIIDDSYLETIQKLIDVNIQFSINDQNKAILDGLIGKPDQITIESVLLFGSKPIIYKLGFNY